MSPIDGTRVAMLATQISDREETIRTLRKEIDEKKSEILRVLGFGAVTARGTRRKVSADQTLELLRACGEDLSASSVAIRLGIPKGSAATYLSTLAREKMVERVGTNLYRATDRAAGGVK